MGRRASGGEVLEQAKACLAKAKTVEELRQAQAVVLPLELGLSLEQTAQAMGVSVGWACPLRTRFVRTGGIPDCGRARRGGRRHENMTRDAEAAFLAPFFENGQGRRHPGDRRDQASSGCPPGAQGRAGLRLQPVASS